MLVTNRQLIDAIKKALDDRTLGAFKYPGCAYAYADPRYACAIGCSLTTDFRQRLLNTDANLWNVPELARVFKLKFENIRLAQCTQILHDCWASYGEIAPEVLVTKRMIPDVLAKHFRSLKGKPVDEAVFRTWIGLLDSTYP